MTLRQGIRRGLVRFGLARPKTVIIIAMLAPLDEIVPGAEVWGCNRSYLWQTTDPDIWAAKDAGLIRGNENRQKLDRLFFFDDVEQISGASHPEFAKHAADLDIPVITKMHYPEIPKSVAFPLQEVLEKFRLLPPGLGKLTLNEILTKARVYFTSSIAYMVAQAIYEEFDTIVIHRMQVNPHSMEYLGQKSCQDFWLGMAIGRGIRLMISEDSYLCGPDPWEPGLYGYVNQHAIEAIDWIRGNAVAQVLRIDHKFSWSKDLPPETIMGDGEKDILPELSLKGLVLRSTYNPAIETTEDEKWSASAGQTQPQSSGNTQGA
ncbi:hypothetical protein LCGC14_0355270 [marine sediment metagenome]|uniref:Uncharacterized protein n=1 Tax=marine sediment metagenome TaxID=412755 RepID=A0A0F9TSN1_9ZZZZ